MFSCFFIPYPVLMFPELQAKSGQHIKKTAQPYGSRAVRFNKKPLASLSENLKK